VSAKSLWYMIMSYHRSFVPSDTGDTGRAPVRVGWRDAVRLPSASPFIPFMQHFRIVGYGYESRDVVKLQSPGERGRRRAGLDACGSPRRSRIASTCYLRKRRSASG
jgi:hypothetical protein